MMSSPATGDPAATILSRCDLLGAISEEDGRLTRRFATPALGRAMEAVAGWFRDAGMATRRDAVGNLIGRYEGAGPDRRILLLGSHLDTVRDAGRYDGPLGVLVALAAVEALAARGARLPFAVEILAFADEEGLRYRTAYLGSAAVAGRFDPVLLDRVDDDGVPLADAIAGWGGDPATLAAGLGPAWPPADLLGYCEVHIEQGPVLEARGAPVGVVTAIQGASRVDVAFDGVAGHAGTVPPKLRRDALTAAAEFVLAVEGEMRATPGLAATVGQLAVEPGASNVIPGRARLSLDLRHPDDAARAAARGRLRERAGRIAADRGADLTWTDLQETPAVHCSPRLTGLLERAVVARGLGPVRLASGAGHDGVVLAQLTDVAMLFVRCAGGISHHPAEAVTADDVATAVAVLGEFLRLLDDTSGRAGGS